MYILCACELALVQDFNTILLVSAIIIMTMKMHLFFQFVQVAYINTMHKYIQE